MLPQLIGAIIGSGVTVFLSAISKLWEPFSDYLGIANPSDRRRRLDDHEHAVKKVTAAKDDFLQNDAYPSSQQAQHWLQRVNVLQTDKLTIHAEYEAAGRNWLKQCRCARQATKEQKRADDLFAQYKDLCQEPKIRPRPVECVQLEKMLRMEPYMKSLFDFIKKTEENKSSLLGIWGMCGVGKSTLLKLISTSRSKYAASDESFEILFVHAGRDCTIGKLQKAISELLGLELKSSMTCQAIVISSYLRGKSFLLLLDDIWQPLNLEDVGIRPHRTQNIRQIVVLTSRIQGVCSSMECGTNIIHMVCPSEQVAMDIFSDAAGAVMKDVRITELAKMIVEECGRLPAALQKIGLAMSSKKEIYEWEYTIYLLRESKLHAITHKNEDLLDRLKWSYDQLEDSFKPGFLICSLWHEEENIPMDTLIRWWTGMGVLDGPNAYMKGVCNIRKLQNASLLENGDNGLCTAERSHVRMHDMVRKMALGILNESKEIWACNSSCRPPLTEAKWNEVQKAWASSKDTEVLVRKATVKSTYQYSQQLTMLVIRHAFNLQPIGLFQNIVFLDMEGSTYNFFPLEICSMMNLQYLNLSSTRIHTLPKELTSLPKLKYLYIRDNCALRHIAEGVIAKLVNLEEFDLFCTSSMCISCLLKDIEKAVNLSLIGFTVQTEAEVQELVRLRQVHAMSVCLHQFKDQSTNLQLLSEMKKCRELHVADSPNVTELVAQSAQVILPYVESFEIRNLQNLVRVILNSKWLSMTTVNVSYCGKLIDLVWIQQLVNLEQLTVSYCEKIEILVSVSSIPIRNQDAVISLPNLKKIHLQELPELSTLCDVHLRLDSISHFCIVGCRKLIRLPVQQHNTAKVRLDCDEAWWREVVAVPENRDMQERFSTDPDPWM